MSQAPPEPSGPGGDPPAPLERVLDELEGAVRRLADQSAPLERLVSDWERAQALAREAERRLEQAERRLRKDQAAPNEGGPEAPSA